MIFLIWSVFGMAGIWALAAMFAVDVWTDRNKVKEPKFDLYKERDKLLPPGSRWMTDEESAEHDREMECSNGSEE